MVACAEALNNTQDILPAESVEKLKKLHECLTSLGDSSGIKVLSQFGSDPSQTLLFLYLA